MANSTIFYPHPTDAGNAGEFFFTYTHTATGGVWGPLLVLSVFVISYLALSSYKVEKSFAASAFTATVTAALLAPFGVINQGLFILTAFTTVLAVLLAGGDRGV